MGRNDDLPWWVKLIVIILLVLLILALTAFMKWNDSFRTHYKLLDYSCEELKNKTLHEDCVLKSKHPFFGGFCYLDEEVYQHYEIRCMELEK